MICATCPSLVSINSRTGLCTKCRSHKNYLNKQQKYIDASRNRYDADRISSSNRDTCSTANCSNILNKNNVSGKCRQHYEYITSPEYKKKHNKKWYDQNGKEYYSVRRKDNIEFKLRHNLRARLRMAILNEQVKGSAIGDLGCPISELKTYLESLFQEGMSWENYGKYGWHIDHIIPLASFVLTNPDEFKKACHYTNLQPLWAKDNLRKGSKELFNQDSLI